MPDDARPRSQSGGGAAAPDARRIQNEPAFVLHTRPWKETSLVLELLTRRHGRVVAVAKGARRPQSALRPVLMPFQPLLATWSGRHEVRLLHSVEWRGGIPQLSGTALLCGFYLNELLMAALAREDPHEDVFDAYHDALRELVVAPSQGGVLRRFEMALLAGLGYGLALHGDAASGAALVAVSHYRYLPERGAMAVAGPDSDDPLVVRGATLQDMARGDFTEVTTASESRRLMRALIAHHLGNPPLHSRQLLLDVRSQVSSP